MSKRSKKEDAGKLPKKKKAKTDSDTKELVVKEETSFEGLEIMKQEEGVADDSVKAETGVKPEPADDSATVVKKEPKVAGKKTEKKKAEKKKADSGGKAESKQKKGEVGSSGVNSDRFRLVEQQNGRGVVSEVDIPIKANSKVVVLWMSRDQRVQDNWAMLLARGLAKQHRLELQVVFNLVPQFLEATLRQYDFMLKGLEEVEKDLRALHIPFHLLMGHPKETVPAFTQAQNAGVVVCDMSPLRVPRLWVKEVAKGLQAQGISMVQCDAHNVVPVWIASDKREYAARTIRNKIHSQLGPFLKPFPSLEEQAQTTELPELTDWEKARATLRINQDILPVDWCKPGAKAAMSALDDFIQNRLKHFAKGRNNPNDDVCSNLSPYFHFGQLAPQKALLEVSANRNKGNDGANSFIEEALVRRELSDNYCWYEPNYDSLEAAYPWARESLELHKKDRREYVYSRAELEAAVTHDDLWNASQLQMVRTGKMHGFLRMYWAKKILEWSADPAEALATSIYLNDKYELDGRDPNGYVGCAWSIMGVHDMGWTERPIFGKIRYMNYAGCKRKFDLPAFVKRFDGASPKSEQFKLAQAALKKVAKK
eukprot:g37480.t1